MGPKRKRGILSSDPKDFLAKMMRMGAKTGQDSDEDDKEPDESDYTKDPQLDAATRTVVKALDVAGDESDIHIPGTINIMRFAECRATEIATIVNDVKLKGNKLSLQQLPHHMRRRAASHNSNRVPRRLREKAAKEIVKAKKTKRPSRRHRRRPSNLLLDYIRRQRKHVWLETHIWFKKRFKVAKLWGYQLPLHPNEKNRRSAHTSVTQFAMLQDMSYLCCIELEGRECVLLEKLSNLTDSSSGFTFASKSHIHGTREGKTILYHPNAFPFQAIGPVSFLWQPTTSNNVASTSDNPNPGNGHKRKLWIWCHPSMYEELVNVLTAIFNLKKSVEIAESMDLNQLAEKPDGNGAIPEKSVELRKEAITISRGANENSQAVMSFQRSPEAEATRLTGKRDPKTADHIEESKDIVRAVLEDAISNISMEIDDNVQSELIKAVPVDGEGCEAKTQSNQANCPAKEDLMEVSTPEETANKGTENKAVLKCELTRPNETSDGSKGKDGVKTGAVKSCKGRKCFSTSNKPTKSKKSNKISNKNEIMNLMLKFSVCDPKLIARMRTPESYSHGGVTVTLLKDHLVRHKLIGPHSLPILTGVLKVAHVACEVIVSKDQKWWEDFYGNEKMLALHEHQKAFWSDISASNRIPSGIALALTVGDPRIDIPPKKTQSSIKREMNSSSEYSACAIPDGISDSPLWDIEIRNKVTTTKQKESEINKLRSSFLVPGSRLDLGREESRIPIILVHQPGNATGYGEGWDIIAPCGWSMAFWIAFIYNGARAYGLRELKSISNNAGLPLFPFMHPDTCSGQKCAEDNRLEKMAKHLRYPPNKRPSFEKLGIHHPFFMPYDLLVKEWKNEFVKKTGLQEDSSRQQISIDPLSNSSPKDGIHVLEVGKDCRSDYFLLRSRKEIYKLKELCLLLKKHSLQKSVRQSKQLDAIEETFRYFTTAFLDKKDMLHAIVCLRIECINRGKACSYSDLYIPEESDLLMLKNNASFGGPSEAVHVVASENLVERKSKKHKRNRGNCSMNTRKDEDAKDLNEREELKRPVINNLISLCSRKVVGFLEYGGFSFASGHGVGIGHCSLVSLIEILKLSFKTKMQPIVLVRQQNSVQYRFAKVDIIDIYT